MIVLAALALLLGLWLVKRGRSIRSRLGLGDGVTLSLDQVTLSSKRLGLVGRPDRLYSSGGKIIIEEWKSARSVQPWHRVQMGVYFLLAEERYRAVASHGFLVTGDGGKHRIDNTPELRAEVLAIAAEIRRRRKAVAEPVAVSSPPWKCRPCGMRGHCRQASA